MYLYSWFNFALDYDVPSMVFTPRYQHVFNHVLLVHG